MAVRGSAAGANTRNTDPQSVWRVWIDSDNRVVSFHEMEGGRLMEFRNQDMFLSCVEQYATRHYRYQ